MTGAEQTNSLATLRTFFETFDGGMKTNKVRLEVPKWDILFKVPYCTNTVVPFNVPLPNTAQTENYNIPKESINFFNQPYSKADQVYQRQTMTQNNLVNMYMPELLQNNKL